MKEQAFPPSLKQKIYKLIKKKEKRDSVKKEDKERLRSFMLTRNKLPWFKVDDLTINLTY